MEMNYTYPVILDYGEKQMINVILPNFGDICTCVEKENYIEEIQDFLALQIEDYEASGKELPKPLQIDDIEIKDNQKLILVNLWMPYQRSKIKVEYVKKTLTIPSWLDILAKEKHLNFSSVLVSALKRELGLERK